MRYAIASGRLTYWINAGRFFARFNNIIAMVSIKTSGPCCQSARVAIDHIDVQRENIAVIANAIANLLNWLNISQKKMTAAAAPKMLAITFSRLNCNSSRSVLLNDGFISAITPTIGAARSDTPIGNIV